MSERPRIALVLGGGAARGLAHVGAIEVIERAGLAIDFLAGSSMGGLVGALHATGLESRRILEIARGFRFPAWFLPGALIPWERVFPTAARVLRDAAFESSPALSRSSPRTRRRVGRSSWVRGRYCRRSGRPAPFPPCFRPRGSTVDGCSTVGS